MPLSRSTSGDITVLSLDSFTTADDINAIADATPASTSVPTLQACYAFANSMKAKICAVYGGTAPTDTATGVLRAMCNEHLRRFVLTARKSEPYEGDLSPKEIETIRGLFSPRLISEIVPY